MLNKEEFEKYENKFKSLDLSKVTPWVRYESDVERSLEGEEKVFDILSKYTSNIIRDVVMWGRKRDRVTEIDLAAEINGYLLICEVKEWYGRLSSSNEANKITLSFVNTSNRFAVRTRMSPFYTLSSFSDDLRDYLKPNKPVKDVQLIRCVIFTRHDLVFDQSFDKNKSSVKALYLEEFDAFLKELASKDNKNPYHLKKPLPSWDYYYSEFDNKWFECSLISHTINTDKGVINSNLIDSIIFSDDYNEPSLIKLRSGEIIISIIDKRTVFINTSRQYVSRYCKYLKLNPVLHGE